MIKLIHCTQFLVGAGTLALLLGVGSLQSAHAAGIVESIEKAPVIADGDVAGQPTDIVISFTGSKDHHVPGRTLAAGDEIRIIFPWEFDLANIDPNYPLRDVPWPFPPVPPLPPMPCVPTNLQCTTAVMLQGWPQQPPFPPALFHTLSVDLADNALVFTALQDIAPLGPASPGIKELHLILHGVINPEPGEYFLRVEAQTGPGGSWEYGSGIYKVLPHARPSINITSVFVKALAGILSGSPACGPGTLPPNPDNPVYQTTGLDEAAPINSSSTSASTCSGGRTMSPWVMCTWSGQIRITH